ncbi:MAG: PEP-CTERM sorting domain-containing protein [Limisphaerales bacterium]
MKKLVVLSLAALLTSLTARSAVSFTGSYTQDFNSLGTSGGSIAWLNDSTLAGWSLFQRAGAAITTYAAGDGSSNTGSFYSFGTGTTNDRALGGTASGGAYFGSPATGALAGYIAVALQNTSGNDFSSITLSFSGEQWRNGGNATAQTMVLQYGFGSTFASVATWVTPGGLFNFTSPVASASPAAVNGNVAGKVTGLGGTISTTWANNTTLWVRWIENNDAGNDHGLAVDDLTVSAAPVPEPSSIALAALGGVLGLVAMRRKR